MKVNPRFCISQLDHVAKLLFDFNKNIRKNNLSLDDLKKMMLNMARQLVNSKNTSCGTYGFTIFKEDRIYVIFCFSPIYCESTLLTYLGDDKFSSN